MAQEENREMQGMAREEGRVRGGGGGGRGGGGGGEETLVDLFLRQALEGEGDESDGVLRSHSALLHDGKADDASRSCCGQG